MRWIAEFWAMMGLGLSLAIPKGANAGSIPPVSDELPYFPVMFR